MLGFDSIGQTPLAALPIETAIPVVTGGFSMTMYLGGNEVFVIWNSVVVPSNAWTPINIFYPT